MKIAILAVFLVLALSNTARVPFTYLPGMHVEWPLIVILFIAFAAGAVFGIFALFGRLLRLRSENRTLQLRLQKAEKTVQAAVPPAEHTEA